MSLAKVGTIGSPNVTEKHVYKFGFNAAVGATAETIWLQGGLYNWKTSATVVNVTSSSAADDVGSTGATSVTLEGLDANYDEISEVVALDGQTIAQTNASFFRVHRAYCTAAGTGGTNAGTIYVFTGTATAGAPTTATQIYTTIGVGAGQTLQTFYTIPAGYSGYIYGESASSYGNANNFATMDLRIRTNGGPWRTQSRFVISRGSVRIPHDIPLRYPEKTDIEFIGTSDGTAVDVAAQFDIILDKN